MYKQQWSIVCDNCGKEQECDGKQVPIDWMIRWFQVYGSDNEQIGVAHCSWGCYEKWSKNHMLTSISASQTPA